MVFVIYSGVGEMAENYWVQLEYTARRLASREHSREHELGADILEALRKYAGHERDTFYAPMKVKYPDLGTPDEGEL